MAEHESIQFRPGKRFGNWSISDKLDEGGFGQVYIVTRKEKATNKILKAALKAESNAVDGGSAIKLEIQVLQALQEDGEKPHIPFVYHAAKHTGFCYMIMTLLGPNFKGLKSGRKDEKLTVNTWIRLAIQCLYSLKVLHDYGYVHRDIKPNNFVMGEKTDPERARCVFILDFGQSRSYAFKLKNKWYCRLARGSAEFRGTIRYCSPNVHDNIEQGRRDDIWSLFYVLIELHGGLPWQTTREKNKIEMMKCHMQDSDLTQNMPRELRSIIPDLRKLDYYSRPDYLDIYKKMVAVMKRKNIKNDDPYDWEEAGKILKPSKPPAWHDAEAFFASDPVKIAEAPNKADKATLNKYLSELKTMTLDGSASKQSKDDDETKPDKDKEASKMATPSKQK